MNSGVRESQDFLRNLDTKRGLDFGCDRISQSQSPLDRSTQKQETGHPMLQSAIFADLQALGVESPAGVLLSRRLGETAKGRFSRLTAWSRAFRVRDELQGLSGHMLRDIGAFGQGE